MGMAAVDLSFKDLFAEQTQFTPDYWRLQQYARQRVFVCGLDMERHPIHWALGNDAIRLGAAVTHDDQFTLWKRKLNGPYCLPIPLEKQFTGTPYANVKGELYSIKPWQFIYLDTH